MAFRICTFIPCTSIMVVFAGQYFLLANLFENNSIKGAARQKVTEFFKVNNFFTD